MNLSYDIVIAGAGLAGACAALHLSRSCRVLVVDALHPAAGASGVGVGMVNPLMSKYARPAWRMDEALDALEETLDLANARSLYHAGGALRPAYDSEQASAFQQSAATFPHHGTWLGAGDVQARYPAVLAPNGGLWVRTGGAVSVPDVVRQMMSAAIHQGVHLRTGLRLDAWKESDHSIQALFLGTEGQMRIGAGFLILAIGAGWTNFPELSSLRLHDIKGQSVTVRTPIDLQSAALPNLAGRGYIVPEGETMTAGSSYEHQFTDVIPSRSQTHTILERAGEMLPSIREASILNEMAGIRVSVPGTRLPMVGPLPGRSRTWLFTGLGSKGLLMAPLLARELPHYLQQPGVIPQIVRVKVRKH